MGLLRRVYQKQANRITNQRPVYKLARFTIGSQHVHYKQTQKLTLHPVTALGGGLAQACRNYFFISEFFFCSLVTSGNRTVSKIPVSY